MTHKQASESVLDDDDGRRCPQCKRNASRADILISLILLSDIACLRGIANCDQEVGFPTFMAIAYSPGHTRVDIRDDACA
jgi:hypothetical protein